MSLVLILLDHVGESGPEVGVDELAVLEFEFEARIKGDNEGRFPTYK